MTITHIFIYNKLEPCSGVVVLKAVMTWCFLSWCALHAHAPEMESDGFDLTPKNIWEDMPQNHEAINGVH